MSERITSGIKVLEPEPIAGKWALSNSNRLVSPLFAIHRLPFGPNAIPNAPLNAGFDSIVTLGMTEPVAVS